ncbi:MAG TPA: hypothetical protein PLQ67_07675, partial [Burkholderiaceae bacterium]|nr:hypothetical protein [Burkholderiaceae bacterium]
MTQTAKILSVNPALVQRAQGQLVNDVSNARVSQFKWIPAKRTPDELNGTYQDLWVGGMPPDRLSIEITKQKNEPEQVKVFKTAIKTKEEETIGVWGRRAWGHIAPHVSAKLSIPHSFNSERHAAALTSGDIRQLGGSGLVFDLFFDASDYDLSRPGTPVSPIGRAEVPQLIATLQKSRGFDINRSYVGISDQNQLEKVIQFRAERIEEVLKKVSKDFNRGRFDPGHRAHMLGTRSIFLDDYYNSYSFLLSEVRFNRYSSRYRRS